MADVSVRFQVAGDAEIVLTLPTPQAVRLMEALTGKIADAMGAPGRSAAGGGWPDGAGPGAGAGAAPLYLPDHR